MRDWSTVFVSSPRFFGNDCGRTCFEYVWKCNCSWVLGRVFVVCIMIVYCRFIDPLWGPWPWNNQTAFPPPQPQPLSFCSPPLLLHPHYKKMSNWDLFLIMHTRSSVLHSKFLSNIIRMFWHYSQSNSQTIWIANTTKEGKTENENKQTTNSKTEPKIRSEAIPDKTTKNKNESNR